MSDISLNTTLENIDKTLGAILKALQELQQEQTRTRRRADQWDKVGEYVEKNFEKFGYFKVSRHDVFIKLTPAVFAGFEAAVPSEFENIGIHPGVVHNAGRRILAKACTRLAYGFQANDREAVEAAADLKKRFRFDYPAKK